MFERGWSARLSMFAAGRTGSAVSAGVHLGGRRLSAVRVRHTAPVPTLESVRQLSVDPQNMPTAIRGLAQAGYFSGARVIASLPGGMYDTITIASPPAVPEEELRDALRWQLRGALSYAPEEATFDFVRLPQASRASAGTASGPAILVIAARRRDVTHALSPFVAAGIEVDVVDIPEMAQRNLLGAGSDIDACRAFLSFDESSALLTVQLREDLCFARRMQLPGAGRIEEEEPEHTADRIATNVQRSLEVFARQSQMPEVASVSVGIHPHAALIARAIAEQAAVAAALFDPGSTVALAPSLQAEFASAALTTPEFVLALGTALRSDQDALAMRADALALPAWLLPRKKAA